MAEIDLRNLPPQVLERLAANHVDLRAQRAECVQRGRILEARTAPITAVAEQRVDGDGNPIFEGYATTYDVAYQVGGTYGWSETIVGGACNKSVMERDDVRLLFDHQGVPLARTKYGTLTLESDSIGLRCGPNPLDGKSPYVAGIASAMARRDLDDMSFAFQVLRQEWDNDYTVRRIFEVKLFDVSIVTFAANPATVAVFRAGVDDDIDRRTGGLSLDLARAQADQLRLARS